MPGGGGQREGTFVGVDLRVQLQEGLVHRAKLLGAEVAKINRPAHGPAAARRVLGEAELADTIEQGLVGQAGIVEVGRRVVGEQERAQAGDTQRSVALAEPEEQDLERFIKIRVRAAAAPVGQGPQATDRVEAGITITDLGRRVGRVQ